MMLIDADKVIADLTAMKNVIGYDSILIDAMIDGLKRQETIDAVEVVRCKDCVFFNQGCYQRYPIEDVGESQRGFCDCNLMDVYDCDYCNNGERRKNDAD